MLGASYQLPRPAPATGWEFLPPVSNPSKRPGRAQTAPPGGILRGKRRKPARGLRTEAVELTKRSGAPRRHRGAGAIVMGLSRTLVLNVVGLTPGLLEHAPNLTRLARGGGTRPLSTVTPAVTTTVQSTLVTGALPRDHGIVANGWYFRDLAEVWLWRQSNRLVGGEKIWEAAARRDPEFTCAKLFWWYNMHSTATWSVTPRPMYPADGRKIPDVYT